MEPILKWAGGKRLLLPELIKYIDFDELNRSQKKLYEPFVGGGALSFTYEYKKSVLNDINDELMNVYNQIKHNSRDLIYNLECLYSEFNLDRSFYYEIRSLDRKPNIYTTLTPSQRAARIIFLNKTCYNGLYRVNSNGEFNVPIGTNQTVGFTYEDKINALHNYLYDNDILLKNEDFEVSVSDASFGDVVYFDPPYDYEPSGFTSYNKYGFKKEDTIRLKKLCDKLIQKGCKVIISNNDTAFINNVFSCADYKIQHINAHRFINRNGNSRNNAKEVIIYGSKE